MSKITKILAEHNIPLINEGIAGKIANQLVEYGIIVGSNALKIWQIIQADYQQFTPLIVSAELCKETLISDDLEQINQDLENFIKIDPQQWFADILQEYDLENEEDDSELLPLEINQFNSNFSIQNNIIEQQFLDSIGIVLLPKISLYFIPIYLQYGGWNSCPYPHEQAAIIKYWSEKYNLQWFGLNHDTFEFQVMSPPDNWETAFHLAKEQMAYCDDLVSQGTITVKRLAECLLNNNIWYFWWD